MPSALIPIVSTTLASGLSSLTFSNIPGSYRDLVLRVNGVTNGTSNLTLQFNGDTAANYNRASVNGNSVSGAYSNSNQGVDRLYGAVGGNTSANVQWTIMDYSVTDKQKQILIRSNSFGGEVNVVSSIGRWASTSAITSITIFGDTYQTGTVLTLYGVLA